MVSESEVAAHAQVALYNAESSHSSGYKLTFQLLDTQDIDAFRKITKARKNHAGGRYRMMLVDGNVDSYEHEVLFLGWSMNHSSGAKIRFLLDSEESFALFRSLPAACSTKECATWHMVMVELADDEQFVDQTKRENVESMLGGPLCKRAAILCNDNSFQRWISPNHEGKATPDECAQFIRNKCDIVSRKELDHDPMARQKFLMKVQRPFILWSA